MNFQDYHSFFFTGIGGTGMSAIAQYLKGENKRVSGSDRLFETHNQMLIQKQFQEMDIACFPQDGSGIGDHTDIVVISTAIEETNPEYQKALRLGIPVVKRSDLLASIANSRKTIAVGGTSGKSTTAAMLFHAVQQCGLDCSLITGAGLTDLQEKGLPGNAWNGKSDWMIIEADESDGSIVSYRPEIGILLNIDRDHKDMDELHQLFTVFKQNTQGSFIVNRDNPHSRIHSADQNLDFGSLVQAGVRGENFRQNGFDIRFEVGDVSFFVPAMGKHNMENVLAVIAVTRLLNIADAQVAHAMRTYRGIYRRTQRVGERKDVVVVDDFAHNPAEVVAAIKSCQMVGERVLAWFQPHGYGPLRFMHKELSETISEALRPKDIFLISDVYYAGGTVAKDIQSDVVSREISRNHKSSVYLPSKKQILDYLIHHAKPGDVILLMGARDPDLGTFARTVLDHL